MLSLKKKIMNLALIFLAIVQISSAVELPKEFHLCHKSDPKVGVCLAEAIGSALSVLKDGYPSLNFPSIEPMKIDEVIVEQEGGTSAFNLKSSFKNAEIHGLGQSIVKRTAVKFNKKFAMRSDAWTEKLDFIGHYKMQGQILVLPIRGEGFSNVSMQGLTTRHDMFGTYYVGDDNQTYINITSYKVKFNPKKVIFRFDNLFNGDQSLSNSMNQFMNDNWEPVFNGMIPGYEEQFGKKFADISNVLFSKVPSDLIFPE